MAKPTSSKPSKRSETEQEGYEEAKRRILNCERSKDDSLNLSHLSLHDLPSEIVALTSVRSIDASHNNLNDFPPALLALPKLQSIILAYNNIEYLPDSLITFHDLHTLNLAKNNCVAIPDWLASLPSLSQLNFDFNRLSSLPDSLLSSKTLVFLQLQGNRLSSFVAYDLPRLTWLDLDGNEIRILGEGLAKASPRLETLYIKNNGLRSLPSNIGSLKSLSRLDIKRNDLRSLPQSISNLASLNVYDSIKRNGLEAADNPFDDPRLVELSRLPQPQSTREILRYLGGSPSRTESDPNEHPIPPPPLQRPAAFQFGLEDGHLDALPQSLSTLQSELAADLYTETKRKAQNLLRRLENSNSSERLKDSVSRVIEALDATLPKMRVGVLRARSRTIEADALAFGDDTERELFPDAISMLNDLSLSLQDLQSCFPIIRELEAESLALQIQVYDLGEISSLLTAVSDAADKSDLPTKLAKEALKALETDRSLPRSSVVRARVVADDALVKRNFVSAVLRTVVDGLRTEAGDFGKRAWKGAKKGIEKGTEKSVQGAVVAAAAALASAIGGVVAGLAVVIGAFGPLKQTSDLLRKKGVTSSEFDGPNSEDEAD